MVRRELGRLSESEAAFRQVIQLTPDLAFGYYNLGHTLFLQGRYQAALSAYAEGQGRDAEKNPVQATRLALCKIATGDAEGALRDLQQATARAAQGIPAAAVGGHQRGTVGAGHAEAGSVGLAAGSRVDERRARATCVRVTGNLYSVCR